MKRFSVYICLLVLTLASPIWAQLELPRVSQKASLMQRVGLLDVTINYSRPNVKGRKIWGDLVPYNQVWRTGADEATTIFFSDDAELEGNKIPAGKYALFTIPGRDEWTVIINKTWKQWGAFNYDSTKDLVRFKVKPADNQFTESMGFCFSDVTTSSANINIEWEKVKVTFTLKFDIDAKAYSNIKKAIDNADKDDWVVYAASANYAADNKIHQDEAMQWVDKSISIKPTYYNYFVKAKLLADNHQTKEALSYIEKSRQMGKNDPEFKDFKPQVDVLEHELKAKRK
ncbi:MAG TPA: DUF2911 domain-containing protein [Ignavibacteriales bacterium]|nr:DUF2911 domain-containing protein [Ignavibacteriales bacterium]